MTNQAGAAALRPGRVVASHGRHLLVEDEAGQRRLCHPRGKKNEAVVGDLVRWCVTGDEGSIEGVEPRRNRLYRQDEMRTKSFAANVDQVLLLLAAEPLMPEQQLARALIAIEAAQIKPLLALNKADLSPAFEQAWQRLAPYRSMGYTMLPLALKPRGAVTGDEGAHALGEALRDRVTLLLGASGVGKSTLVNRLLPHAEVQTGEVSAALGAGRHTTTSTAWYWLDDARHAALIDSPGFQSFGLHHIAPAELAALMPDFRPFLGRCRFHNCTHLHEPGCAVLEALSPDAGPQGEGEGEGVGAARHRVYAALHAELTQAARHAMQSGR